MQRPHRATAIWRPCGERAGLGYLRGQSGAEPGRRRHWADMVPGMPTTEDIRRWAMALPEVEETSHFRFHVPVFKVRGRTFLGMGAEETTAVFCISEQQADRAAAADPGVCEAVRRRDARRSFLGLQVEVGQVSRERIRSLVEEAWRQQAPKRLAADHDQSEPPGRSQDD